MPEPVPYRLSLGAGLQPFRPEIEYACDFLDSCHALRRTPDAAAVLHYGENAPDGAIVVPATLFPNCVRLAEDGIHPDPIALSAMQTNGLSARLMPPSGTGLGATGKTLAYDAIGLIFFMLSRLEERGCPESDSYGRFRHTASLAVRAGRHADPPADQAAHDLAAAITGDRTPRTRTTFTVEPTHDADRLRGYHRVLEPLRLAAGDIARRRRPRAAWRRLTEGYLSGEPWRSTRNLMRLSERFDLTSRFYFMGPTASPLDSPYTQTMPRLLRRVAREITERGHVIGFHPGSATATDPEEWRRQRDGLEEAIGQPVKEGRQHGLRFVADRTPAIWADSGMRRDLTLGYPEIVGFRSGTCRRHRAYGLRERRPLDVELSSTAVMEFGLFGGKYRNLAVDQALAECTPAIEACRRYGGTFVVLVHTGLVSQPIREFYKRLLQATQ